MPFFRGFSQMLSSCCAVIPVHSQVMQRILRHPCFDVIMWLVRIAMSLFVGFEWFKIDYLMWFFYDVFRLFASIFFGNVSSRGLALYLVPSRLDEDTICFIVFCSHIIVHMVSLQGAWSFASTPLFSPWKLSIEAADVFLKDERRSTVRTYFCLEDHWWPLSAYRLWYLFVSFVLSALSTESHVNPGT